MSMISPDTLGAILEAAVAAPSADNRHLFKLEVLGAAILLHGNEEFGAAAPHRKLLALISFGAVAENMILRAARFGVKLRTTWFPSGVDVRVVARFDFKLAEPQVDPLEAAILHRHTNRRPWFRGPPLTAQQQSDLAHDASAVGQVALLWLDRAGLRRKALRLVQLAETARFRQRELHDELFASIRFDVGWRASASERLPPGSLEIEPGLRAVFASLANWNVSRALNVFGAHHLLALRAAQLPCRLAPHLCGLTARMDDAREAAVAVGRAFERIWLRLTLIGFELQPLAASALFAHADSSGVSASVRHALVAGWSELSPTAPPLMLFRVGRARAPTVRAGRVPIDAILVPQHGPEATTIN